MAKTKKLSPQMIEALRVAYVHGSVWAGARWEIGTGYVKTGTVVALIERDLIMRSPSGEWELTLKGINALAEHIVTLSAQAHDEFESRVAQAHAEALIEAGDRVGYYVGLDVAPAEALDVERDFVVPTRWSASRPECGHEHRHLRCADCDDVMELLHTEALHHNETLICAAIESSDEREDENCDSVPCAPAAEFVNTYACGRSWRWHGVLLTCDVRVSEGQYNASVSNQHSVHEGPCYDSMRREWDAPKFSVGDKVIRVRDNASGHVTFVSSASGGVLHVYIDKDGFETVGAARHFTHAASYGAVKIHTAGELHGVPDVRATFTYNLSDLLDDPAHKPGADLIELDGLDSRVQAFVFATDGATDLYEDAVRQIERQLTRGKSVTVLVLCRGGRHRSVAFGDNLAAHFSVHATHHHRHLPVVKKSR